jgi:hypothetical protein
MSIAAACAVVVLAACGQDGATGEAAGGGGTAPEMAQLDEGATGATSGGGGGGALSAAPLGVPEVGPTVIKTADLDLTVDHDGFAGAMGEATDVAARHGGFVVSSTRGGEESDRGSVTIRVPSDRFEAALADLRGLGEVQREHVGGQDVGQEFVDLEARLRNFEAQEAVLLRLFDDATSVADTIRIQNELSGVQLDIEQLEGRLRYLRDQTSFATISVAVVEEGSAAPGRLSEAWRAAGEALLATAAALVMALGYLVPLAIVGLLGWIGFRGVRRRWGAAPQV